MPGKKPKAGFPGWGLNQRIVTDQSIALTRSDLPDTHPYTSDQPQPSAPFSSNGYPRSKTKSFIRNALRIEAQPA